MAKLKNSLIVAMIAMINLQIKAASSDEDKAALQLQIDQLTELDAQVTIYEGQAVTIEGLNDQLAKAGTDLSNANVTITDLQGKLNTALAGLDELPGLKAAAAFAKEYKIEVEETIEDLKEQLEKALDVKAKASEKPVGEAGGVKYVINSGAHGYGSAEEISKNEDSINAILAKKGQTIITLLID